MKTLRFKKDTEFNFYDANGDFIHSRMTIKKDTLISIRDDELEIRENIPGCKYDKCYFITFDAWKYDKDLIDIKMINQTPESPYTEDFLRHEEAGIFIPTSDVELIFQQQEKEIELLNKLHQMYKDSDDSELKEIGDLSDEEFEEYERDQYSIEIFYNRNSIITFEEYLQWAIDEFGYWGCPPQ